MLRYAPRLPCGSFPLPLCQNDVFGTRLAGTLQVTWSVPVQVLTIFFATFLAGSFFNQVQLFVNNPASIVRILGAAAPQTASFFMSYLLLLGLTTKPVLFLRIPREHYLKHLSYTIPRQRPHVLARTTQNRCNSAAADPAALLSAGGLALKTADVYIHGTPAMQPILAQYTPH